MSNVSDATMIFRVSRAVCIVPRVRKPVISGSPATFCFSVCNFCFTDPMNCQRPRHYNHQYVFDSFTEANNERWDFVVGHPTLRTAIPSLIWDTRCGPISKSQAHSILKSLFALYIFFNVWSIRYPSCRDCQFPAMSVTSASTFCGKHKSVTLWETSKTLKRWELRTPSTWPIHTNSWNAILNAPFVSRKSKLCPICFQSLGMLKFLFAFWSVWTAHFDDTRTTAHIKHWISIYCAINAPSVSVLSLMSDPFVVMRVWPRSETGATRVK